ncbi:hypothetical protein METBIDRAFT_29321 [Metschnikowia bicuspidata var. bicuspidata NRRL YB-4993]|uniref:Vacuolar protein sorting-associated protein 8 central domain-containing protein n=1 Tax=Metschnikowia bicuspidata var. bicuspidata NRRL YB-4993 TaxID=869754 RepID=A0A1A0HF18_9ASCO|nr:hypothetical protein METBIDRAFT_29321 [Metschnikowia bicuspidata var. bicuspidata NRRL YB-4993]OBA22724.1 hypothetical protein METBIDRAFT_29321 [Metschnikowia bicuspidata var. bicuspidata NRRL YB-4993]
MDPSHKDPPIGDTITTGVLLRRRAFDTRAQTDVAIRLQAPRPPGPSQSHRFLPQNALFGRQNGVFSWNQPPKIARALGSPKFAAACGSPTALELSPSHIFVGTHLGRVAVFDYLQNMMFLLQTPTAGPLPAEETVPGALHVTCVAVSTSGSHVCAGHTDGLLVVWEIPRLNGKNNNKAVPTVVEPLDVIPGMSASTSRGTGAANDHIAGVPVNSVSFLGDLSQNMVSSDVGGHVIFHHGCVRLFRRHYVTQRLVGPQAVLKNDPSHGAMYASAVHDCRVLPVGPVPHLADHMGLVAVISARTLTVLSVCSLDNDTSASPKTHFKASRPKNVSIGPDSVTMGCVAWYPSVEAPAGGRRNAKLAYSWNNVTTILELAGQHVTGTASDVLADLKGKPGAVPQLELTRTARWTAPEKSHRTVALQWLNSEILAALVQDTSGQGSKIHFLYYTEKEGEGSLTSVAIDDVGSQLAACMEFLGTSARLEMRLYNSSFRILKHRPVVLVESHFGAQKSLWTGATTKWTNRLAELIGAEKYTAALLSAYKFYCSEYTGQLLLCGLPHTAAERHVVVEPFLLDIMRKSISAIFGPGKDTGPNMKSDEAPGSALALEFDSTPNFELGVEDGLWLYFHLATMITKNNEGVNQEEIFGILDAVHETIDDLKLFFDTLEMFILAREIRSLTPSVFKSLVEFYVSTGRGDRLTEIICILDTHTLNIDLTLKLCEAHDLRECLVYIWTALLQDYTRPLMMLMADIDLYLCDSTKRNLVYTYLSYILSGRQFPTDQYMSASREELARGEVCKILFALREINTEATNAFPVSLENTAMFPYLCKLLRFDAFETLATLNEFFENPCLNTESKGHLNRQYIVEALLDIFQEANHTFSLEDRVYLAIFLARNYPKYLQFIRISDSVLEQTVEMLCNSARNTHCDAELALESLLPVYNVKNEEFFQERVKAAKFYRVAFQLNRSKQKFSNALEVWLEQQRGENFIDIHNNFSVFADLISHAFTDKGVSMAEQTRLMHIISKNFLELAARHLREMVLLANSYNSSFHRMVLDCPDDELAYRYLRILFQETEVPNFGSSKTDLLVKFVVLSCDFSTFEVPDLVNSYWYELAQLPYNLKRVEEKLQNSRCFEALAVLSRNTSEYRQSIDYLKKGLNYFAAKEEWNKVDELTEIGITVCNKDKSCWQLLVQILVALKSPPGSDSSLPKLVNQGIYRCFRSIIDLGEKEQNPKLFTDILQDVMDEATVSQVREVLQETLTSFYFDSEIHNITLAKLNGRIRKYMEYIETDRLRGWILKEKECASCGKPMWGDEVSGRHHAAWEKREKAKAFSDEFDEQEFKDCELALFKCQHGYHSQCLERLGSVGQCVICIQ